MNERIEELGAKVHALLGICEGSRSRESMRAVFPEYSDAEMCQALVMLCERGLATLGPAGASLPQQEAAESDVPESAALHEVAEELSILEGDGPAVFEPVASHGDPEFEEPSAESELVAESQSEWAPEITGETLLLGVDAPRDYSDTYLSADEIDSVIKNLGLGVGSVDRESVLPPAPSERVETGRQEEPNEQVAPVAYGASIKRFGLSDYASTRLIEKGINRVEELVAAFGSSATLSHGNQRCFREARKALANAAVGLPWDIDVEQLAVLRGFAKSDSYVFDLFGVLCRTGLEPSETEEKWEGDPFDPQSPASAMLPIERLFLSPALVNLLKERGIGTVGDIVGLGRDGLLALRSLGENKTRLVLEAMERGLRREGCDEDSVLSVSAFETSYSQEAVFLTGLLEQTLAGRSYPLQHDAFVAMVLPMAAERLGASDAEHAFEPLLGQLEGSERLVLACQIELDRKLRKLRKRIQKRGAGEDLFVGVPAGQAWDTAANHIVGDDASLCFDGDTRRISVVKPTVSEWAATLKDNQRIAMELRLSGKTLEECGKELSVTRERVRQITAKALKGRPVLAEDSFLPFFEAYLMTEGQFRTLTDQPAESYEYLCLVAATKRDERAPLEAALDDAALDEGLRERIRSIVDEGFVYVNGARVQLKRQPVMEALLKLHASDKSVSLDELLGYYRAFVDEHGMDDESAFCDSGPRAISACLERWEFSMVSSRPVDDDGVRRDIRYFDWAGKDFGPLREYLRSWAQQDIECSAAMLMRDSEGALIAADLGLQDEYELHSVLRRGVGDIPGMEVRKRSMVRFGEGDRSQQVLDLIQELGPVDANDLAEVYSERYGVAPLTFRGSYLRDFKIYESDGLYCCAGNGLTADQQQRLERALDGCDYMALARLRACMAEDFPDDNVFLGASALASVGYRISGDLAIRDGVDEAVVFGQLIDRFDTFGVDDGGFGPEVFRNESFRSALNKRIRSFDVVEYMKDRFLRVDTVLSRGAVPVSKDDLRDYVNAVVDFMEPGVPYSVRSLRQAGFSHKVSLLRDRLPSGGDYFFGSLIATGYVGERLKLTSICGVPLFCRKQGPFSSPDVVVYMVEEGPVGEKDLRLRLLTEHGVEIALPMLRSLCKRAGVALVGATSDGDSADGQEGDLSYGDEDL